MAIFLEGCDLAGKTRLAKRLAKLLNMNVVTRRDRGPNQAITGLALAGYRHAVVDRWWPTEWVYRTAEGKAPCFNLTSIWVMNLTAERNGAVYVQLEPSDEQLVRRYAERGDDLHELATIRIINGHYKLQSEKWWKYLPSCRLTNPRVVEILAAHGVRAERARAYPGSGLGALRPKVLFVGECINPRACMLDTQPFTSVHHRGSVKVLYSLFDAAGLTPSDVHVHNAFTQRGEPLLTQATLDFLQPARIIALGQRALSYLQTVLRVAVAGELPHPAWIARFDFANTMNYLEPLRSLL